MKNNSVTIEAVSLSSLVQCPRQNTLKQIFPAIQNLICSYKEEIKCCLATVAVGTIFLGSILLFFIQLSKYGW
ncbi:MAG: hypothetical protein BA862_06010 [Desulfobulbaceae bacterium S3730MH12]|nr:MAG: hypothetical protein BA866_04380 [Desulfobulbaceae bacterium S5133MH15]OEU58835.1 MAG: hypothetical protein BA862_06010 [Desulfobulbaceae bacterium S3730MH12]OEU82276.1 MAG: hypothetical protein BA873_05970 [Desulfobulbaceae bacterium C00003063]